MQDIDESGIMEGDTALRALVREIVIAEVAAFARVLRRSLLLVVKHWDVTQQYPPMHPYRQAIAMITSFVERTFGA